jgi:hypothetical protein
MFWRIPQIWRKLLRMTEIEGKTVYVTVKEALNHGEEVPTCQRLVLLLEMDKEHPGIAPAHLARLVNERLLKLNKEHQFLHKRKRKGGRLSRAWFVDSETFVTEPESAFYLKALVEACTASPDNKISRADFHEKISRYGFTASDLDQTFERANRNGYIKEIGSAIRPTERTHSQLPYLLRRSEDRK